MKDADAGRETMEIVDKVPADHHKYVFVIEFTARYSIHLNCSLYISVLALIFGQSCAINVG
jgi:hypothetical protein